MAKTIFINDGKNELSEEERKELQDVNEIRESADLQREVEASAPKIRIAVEQLFLTRIDPREDRVVVYPDPVDEITSGGIIKPKEVIDKERPLFGTVIAVGPGKKIEQTITNKLLMKLVEAEYTVEALADFKKELAKESSPLFVGMRVIFGRWAGTPINDPETNTPVLMMRPDDIFAQIK